MTPSSLGKTLPKEASAGTARVSTYKAGRNVFNAATSPLLYITGWYLSLILRILGVIPTKLPSPSTWELCFYVAMALALVASWVVFLRRSRYTEVRFDLAGIALQDMFGPRFFVPWEQMTAFVLYSRPGKLGPRVAVDIKDMPGLLASYSPKDRNGVKKHFVFGPDLILLSFENMKITEDEVRYEIESRSSIPVEVATGVNSITVRHEFQESPQGPVDAKPMEDRKWGASSLYTITYLAGLSGLVAMLTLGFWSIDATRIIITQLSSILLAGFIVCLLASMIFSVWLQLDPQGVSFCGLFECKVTIPWQFIVGTQVNVELGTFARKIQFQLTDAQAYLNSFPENQRARLARRIVDGRFIEVTLASLRVSAEELQPAIRKRLSQWQARQNPEGEA